MKPGTDGLVRPHPAPHFDSPPTSRWDALRSALALAASPVADDHGSFDIHAVLNLLNRLNGTPDHETREDLVSRLADYLTAIHRVECAPEATLSALCEMTRSYAAMRYFMADAIEPRLEYVGRDLGLRTLQTAGITGFLQRAVDSLLDQYIPRLEIAVVPRSRGRIDVVLAIERQPGGASMPPPGWTAPAGASRFTLNAPFVARVRELPRA